MNIDEAAKAIADFLNSEPKQQENKPQDDRWVCSECGVIYNEDRCPCVACGSLRVISIQTMIDLAGPNWRQNYIKSDI
jgi:hypothetical protein